MSRNPKIDKLRKQKKIRNIVVDPIEYDTCMENLMRYEGKSMSLKIREWCEDYNRRINEQ